MPNARPDFLLTPQPVVPDRKSTTGPKTVPKSRMVLRVGIVGHCAEGLSQEELGQLTLGATRIQEELAQLVTVISQEGKEFWVDETPIVRMISCLADGADLVMSEAALLAGNEVEVVIPFDRSVYRAGLHNEEWRSKFDSVLAHTRCRNVVELDGTAVGDEKQSEAYQAAGLIVLQQADLVVAFWRGTTARGVGGTSHVVNDAIRAGIPVLWIPSVGGDWQIIENDQTTGSRFSRYSRNQMLELLRSSHLPHERASEGVREYLGLRRPKFSVEFAWQLFLFIVSLGLVKPGNWLLSPMNGPQLIDGRSNYWADEHADFSPRPRSQLRWWFRNKRHHTNALNRPETLPIPEPLAAAITNRIAPAYNWADGLAAINTASYRVSVVTIYTLGFIAIAAAAIGWATDETIRDNSIHTQVQAGSEDRRVGNHEMKGHEATRSPLVLLLGVIEIAAVAGALGATYLANIADWHRKGLDQRVLAEWLRQFRFHFATVASRVATVRRPDYLGPQLVDRTWMGWVFTAIQREAGLPPIRFNESTLKALKRWIGRAYFHDQMDYHLGIVNVVHRANRVMKRVAASLFLLGLVAAAVHMWVHSPWVSAFCIVLPVAATSLTAIRLYQEMESVPKRSETMARHIAVLAAPFDNLSVKEAALDSRRIGQMVLALSRAMNEEVFGWMTLFEDRAPELP